LEDDAVDIRAQHWFHTRTSNGSGFDRHVLAASKRGTTVSVVLPARNEEATVGAIVRRLRAELVEDVPLVDEIVVIDSGSVDGTAVEANAAGARVVRQCDVLGRLGDVPGKGEALWKSLFVTTGDLLVFVDADLREFDPQFVVGLIGPMLSDDSVGFVKAVYDRPLTTLEGVSAAGGGRVTELVARPLLNLHWPELGGFVQPLAGEYAARRTLLEQVPFCSGYGVEIGLLVDVLELAGLSAMAQVDLGVRLHRNQSDDALGRMAAQVQLTVESRLQAHGKVIFTESPTGTLTQFVRVDGRYRPVSSEVGVSERLPMVTLPEYRARLAAVER
jgi:glucosyl-3-phosphoglycerate synthase